MRKDELALCYLSKGWSVIPLYPGSKRARIPWAEYQTRRPTEVEVTHWWTEAPESNIGIVTGAVSGFIVGDVDPRNGGSVEQMQKDAPSDFVVATPGGGAHFYYRHPGGRVPKAKPRPGIDLQADGCYVVAPGSFVITETYQGAYEQDAGSWAAFDERGLMDAPAWLLGQSTTPPSGGASAGKPAWVSDLLRNGAAPGTRNDSLARLAGYFAGHGVSEDVALEILSAWAQNVRLPILESRETIASVYRKEARTATATQHAVAKREYVVDQFAAQKVRTELETMDLSRFCSRYHDEHTEWLIPEWLPNKTVAFLVSPPGRFKTMLTFDAAISVAGGWPFLGQFPVQHPGPVLIIQQEDAYGDMARRLNRIFAVRAPSLAAVTPTDEDVVMLATGPSIPPVHLCLERGFTLTIENLRLLEEKIDELRPRMVVIDPLYSMTSADDFMMHAAKDMMPLKSLRDAYGCTFLIAAHTKKGAADGREGLWGSQFLNAFLETGWQIRDRQGGEDNQVALLRHFKSAGISPLVNLEFCLDDADGYRVLVTDPDADDAERDIVLDQLRGGAAMTVNELADRVGLSRSTTSTRLNRLRKLGRVCVRSTANKTKVWYIPADMTEEAA